MIMLKYQWLAILVYAFLLFFMVRRIHSKHIKEKFGLLWLAYTLTLLWLLLSDQGVFWLARVLDIQKPAHLILALSLFFILLITLSLSFSVSKQSKNLNLMAQKIAFLEHKLSLHSVKHKPLNPKKSS